jgi:serine/threonine protein kinase
VEEMEPEYQEIQQNTLTVLATKLSIVVNKFESVIRKAESGQTIKQHSNVNEWKYAVMKKSIDSAIIEVKDWQEIFDPTWYLIMRIAAPQLDKEQYRKRRTDPGVGVLASAQSLRTAISANGSTNSKVFLPEEDFNIVDGSFIEFSHAQTGSRTDSTGKTSVYILEEVICPAGFNSAEFTKNVRDLARKLQHSDPKEFGLMNCKGVVREQHTANISPKHIFVFRMPEATETPQSLRKLLTSGPETLQSLSNRFTLAKNLAKSVGYMHTFGFVHKNIRPETVLVFGTPESVVEYTSLVGFESFRTADGRTLKSGDSVWERNLYRHPDRQGENPKEIYIMQHDIYSLGVCLLEIGLWKSLIDYDETRTRPGPSEAFKSEQTTIRASSTILPDVDQMSLDDSDPPMVNLRDTIVSKEHLVFLAQESLPLSMGTRYAELVKTCLTCLDPDNIGFGDEREFYDEDGILVGVRYIEKVRVFSMMIPS